MSLLAKSVAQVIGPRAQRSLWRFAEHQDRRYRASMGRLRQYHNRHLGKRCFVIGNGPSLKQTDLSLLKNEITFGTNRIYMNFDAMGFETTYHVCVNDLVVEQCADEIAALKMPKFVGWHCRDMIDFTPDMQFLWTRGGLRSWFFTDLTEGCWEGNTVTMVALQLAYYMGFSEVILVGVDHSYQFQGKPHAAVVSTGDDPNHFNGNYFGAGFRWHLPDLEGSEMSYRVADFVYRQNGRRILDATVGGKCPVFPKIPYLTLFPQTGLEAA
ncbi:MAG: 6-hydroxymethylpterin diphosphokinase MptE-like protein [Tepidisphaeraceae bacterium]